MDKSPNPSLSKTKKTRILVIRLGALGDLVLCFQAFYEIRAAHPDAEIALLTMPAYAAFARSMPWFDRVLVDERAPAWRIDMWAKLLAQIFRFAPHSVYDLQGKTRQSILHTLLGGHFGRTWSGAAPLCTHPRPWPPTPDMHFTDFVAAQLRAAGIPQQIPVTMDWLTESINRIALPERYVMLIPSCAAGRDYKRWPTQNYAALAQKLTDKNIGCVAVGSKQDADVIAAIRAVTPSVIDLSGKTSLHQLASLARRSVAVVGNDTGPTHLAAATGAPTWALFSDKVNPAWSSPRGAQSHWLQGKPLDSLNVDDVLLALQDVIDQNN